MWNDFWTRCGNVFSHEAGSNDTPLDSTRWQHTNYTKWSAAKGRRDRNDRHCPSSNRAQSCFNQLLAGGGEDDRAANYRWGGALEDVEVDGGDFDRWELEEALV